MSEIDLTRLAEPFPARDIDRRPLHGWPTLDRLVLNTRKAAGGCIEWQGHAAWNGYGRIAESGPAPRKTLQCHRAAYAEFVGEIPAGIKVLHNCPGGDNPRCVNPAHLWLGTQLDNVRDRVAKGRSARGEKNGRAKLGLDDVRFIRKHYVRGHPEFGSKALAERFGVTPRAVVYVLRHVSWKAA